MIPKGMESVEDAWLILKNMYGDSARVMTARKRTIENFGDYPGVHHDHDGVVEQVVIEENLHPRGKLLLRHLVCRGFPWSTGSHSRKVVPSCKQS